MGQAGREKKKFDARVICSGCGKTIQAEKNGAMREDYLHVEKIWGYFSHQDGRKLSFDLCEDCCGRMLRSFRGPVRAEEAAELL